MRRYFEEEMRYLHEEGKVFAAKHPEQARFLNIDSISDRDPYVERLFEGFAFLAGRIHERLDDELPEYTEGFFSLLYPHFLRPIPALSIVEFSPKAGQVSEPTVLQRGTEISSAPVGSEHVACRFETTEDVIIRPLSLESASLSLEADTTHSVALRFRVNSGARIEPEALESVRLFFRADAGVASTMHLFFTRHVERVSIHSDDASEPASSVTLSGQKWIRAGGFGPDEGLLPYSEYTFSGTRLLQEYLNFRQRFWCIDLLGLDQLCGLDGDQTITVNVKFDRDYPEDRRFTDDNFRLHCCPVINLYESDAEPIRMSQTEAEYRVTANSNYRNSLEVYDVLRVVGIEEKTGRRHDYEPFYSFERGANGSNRFFIQSFRRGPDDQRTTYLSLSDGQEATQSVDSEVLSIDVRVTNGSLPREALQENTINELGPDVPAIVDPANLIQPTLIRYAPTGDYGDYFWQLLSHLSLNRASLASTKELAELLRLYDWSMSDANRRRIQGIRDVRWEGKDIAVRGSVVRGGQVTIELEQDHFADEGDICLFGMVMSEFLSMYATINSFVHLKIITKPSERTYEWKPNRGTRAGL